VRDLLLFLFPTVATNLDYFFFNGDGVIFRDMASIDYRYYITDPLFDAVFIVVFKLLFLVELFLYREVLKNDDKSGFLYERIWWWWFTSLYLFGTGDLTGDLDKAPTVLSYYF